MPRPPVCCFFPVTWLPLPRLLLSENTAVSIPGSSLTFLPTTGRARNFQDIFPRDQNAPLKPEVSCLPLKDTPSTGEGSCGHRVRVPFLAAGLTPQGPWGQHPTFLRGPRG